MQAKQEPCETEEGKVKPALQEVQIVSLMHVEQLVKQLVHLLPLM